MTNPTGQGDGGAKMTQAHQSRRVIDLREGYRIEVEPLVIPQGQHGARLSTPRTSAGGRTTWKQAGPMVVADTPEKAAHDLLQTMNHGLLTGVEVRG